MDVPGTQGANDQDDAKNHEQRGDEGGAEAEEDLRSVEDDEYETEAKRYGADAEAPDAPQQVHPEKEEPRSEAENCAVLRPVQEGSEVPRVDGGHYAEPDEEKAPEDVGEGLVVQLRRLPKRKELFKHEEGTAAPSH